MLTVVFLKICYQSMIQCFVPTCISTNQDILELSTSFWLSQTRTSIEQSSVGERKAKKVALWLIKLALKCIKGTIQLLHSHGKQYLLLVILAFNTLIWSFETVKVTLKVSICASSINAGKEGCSMLLHTVPRTVPCFGYRAQLLLFLDELSQLFLQRHFFTVYLLNKRMFQKMGDWRTLLKIFD